MTPKCINEVYTDLTDEFKSSIPFKLDKALLNFHQNIKAICTKQPEVRTATPYGEPLAIMHYIKDTMRKRMTILLQGIVDGFKYRLSSSLEFTAGNSSTEEANEFSSHALDKPQT